MLPQRSSCCSEGRPRFRVEDADWSRGDSLPAQSGSTAQRYQTEECPESVCVWVSGGDPALGTATLEVGLNNHILEAGFEIICSPTAEPGNVEAVRKTLQVCQVELHPFFVYGHDGKAGLNRQQISELDLIRHQMSNIPLLFAVISQDYMSTRRPSQDQSSQNLGTRSLIYDQLCKTSYLIDADFTSSTFPSPSSISPHENPELNPELCFNYLLKAEPNMSLSPIISQEVALVKL